MLVGNCAEFCTENEACSSNFDAYTMLLLPYTYMRKPNFQSHVTCYVEEAAEADSLFRNSN